MSSRIHVIVLAGFLLSGSRFVQSAGAQSVAAHFLLPAGCEVAADNQQENNAGYNLLNRRVAVNPVTNFAYTVVSCDLGEGGGEYLLEISGSSNSQRLVPLRNNLGDLVIEGHGGVAIDPVRNRIYTLGYANGVWALIAVSPATNSVESFRLPDVQNDDATGTAATPLGELDVDPVTGKVYILRFTYAVSVFDGNDHTWSAIPPPIQTWVAPVSLAIDSARHRLYLTDWAFTEAGAGIRVVDLTSGSYIANIPLPADFASSGATVVNSTTNRIYIPGIRCTDPVGGCAGPSPFTLLVMSGEDYSAVLVDIPTPTNNIVDHADILWFPAVAANSQTGRIYVIFPTDSDVTQFSLATLDGSTNAVAVQTIPGLNVRGNHGLALNPSTNLLYVPRDRDGDMKSTVTVVNVASTGEIPTGSSSTQADLVKLTFGDVTSAGSVVVTPIDDPATAGDVPGGFAISSEVAFSISPTAGLQFAGGVTSCFQVTSVNVEADFNVLAVLHREELAAGVFTLVDRTSSRDFATRTICATTTSFSPFYLVRLANRIDLLFDRSRAYKGGSTIPVRVRLLNAAGANVSSSFTPLSVRGLRLIGSNTTSLVNDSGQSSPDSTFRFDSVLGGYIFNLSTRGLASGRYALSLYAATDRSFFYNVEFQVR